MTIEEGDINFDHVNDPIKTEDKIYHKLKSLDLGIDYVGCPLAYRINTRGIEDTQRFINIINQKYPHKKIYVCQHVYVNLLDFGDNFVFTPHTILGDDYFFIPHYNPAYHTPPKRIPIKDRDLKFSFIGDYNTNKIREEVGKLDLENSIFSPIGKWFFSHDQETQNSLKLRYKEVLERTKFPICPQGAGPSTLRFFESLSVGGIPIILNDSRIPEDLNELVIRSSIEEMKDGSIYRKIENIDLEETSKKIYDIYWSEYCNDNLWKSIIKKIEKN